MWLLIDIAKIPRSAYYYYSKQFDSPKPDKYADIKAEIRRIYEESKGRYGYRRITKELKKKFVSEDISALCDTVCEMEKGVISEIR